MLDASRLGLVPCEVCLDPCNGNDFVELREDTTPQIPVLGTRRNSPLEGALQCETHIFAIGNDMQTALRALNSFENCGNLAALSSLGRSHDRAMSRFSDVCGYAPTRARSARGVAAAPIRRDHCDDV